jgi:drug/metabolite transporter (DMT)-like permease
MLLVASMIWGFGFTAQDAINGLHPLSIGAVRSWIAGFFLILVTMLLDRLRGTGRHLFSRRGIDITRVELIGGVLCGIALAAASVLQQFGITGGTDGGKAAFITSLYVVLVPIYSLFLRKRAPINVWISIAIAAVGFYFLCVKENFSIAASDIPVILCALVFPLHILVIDHFSPTTDGARLSMIQFFTCAVIQTAPAFAVSGNTAADIVANTLPLLFLGIGSSGIAYTLQILGQGGVEPAAASIIMSLESVFGVIGAVLILNSQLTEREYIGCAIVLAAVILSQLDFKKKGAPSVPDSPKD